MGVIFNVFLGLWEIHASAFVFFCMGAVRLDGGCRQCSKTRPKTDEFFCIGVPCTRNSRSLVRDGGIVTAATSALELTTRGKNDVLSGNTVPWVHRGRGELWEAIRAFWGKLACAPLKGATWQIWVFGSNRTFETVTRHERPLRSSRLVV